MYMSFLSEFLKVGGASLITHSWQTGAVRKLRLLYLNRGRRTRSRLFPNSSQVLSTLTFIMSVFVQRLTAVGGQLKVFQ